MYKRTIDIKKIERYFNMSEGAFRRPWYMNKYGALHYGFNDKITKSFSESLVRLNVELANFGELKNNSLVLDAGCGVGGSSCWLAQQRGCIVIEITIVKRQIELCNLRKIKFSLIDNLDFRYCDYSNTNFPDSEFDYYWSIEALDVSPEYLNPLQEAYRILKPGGKLLIGHYIYNIPVKNMNKKAQKLALEWSDGMASIGYNDWSTFEEILKKTNFTKIKSKIIIKNIIKSFFRMYILSKIYLVLFAFMDIFGNYFKAKSENAKAGVAQYKLLQLGLWDYRFVSAQKPT